MATREMIKPISEEVIRGIALLRLFEPVLGGPVLHRVREADQGDAVGVVRDSLHKDLCLTAWKLFDSDKDSLSLSLPMLIAAFTEEETVDAAALEEAKRMLEEAMASDHRKRLKNLRNWVIAHNSIRSKDHGALFGDERRTLEDARAICMKAYAALGMHHEGFDAFEEVWRQVAASFWSAVAKDHG